MDRSPTFSLAARLRSFAHALRGIRTTVVMQHNARIHALVTLAVLGLALASGVSRGSWCALVLAIAVVWVAELLNTALESLADALAPDPHPAVGRAKDAAAGAVLLAAVAAAVVGVLVLGPPLLGWLG